VDASSLKSFGWRFVFQRLSRTLVQPSRHSIDIDATHDAGSRIFV